jgi:chaperonin GroEL (HSP60 family)
MTSPSEPSARIDERREEVITEELGLKLENTAITQLGTAKTVKVDKDNTTIINGAGKPKDISDRIRPSAV